MITAGTEDIQGADKTSQDAVFVSDTIRIQAGHCLRTVAGPLPSDDRVIIFLAGHKIPKGRMLQSLRHRLQDGGCRGEIHIRDPHGDHIKAFSRGLGRKAVHFSNRIHSQRIVAAAVHNRGKIIFHPVSPLCVIIRTLASPYNKLRASLIQLHIVHIVRDFSLQSPHTRTKILSSVPGSGRRAARLSASAVCRTVRPVFRANI